MHPWGFRAPRQRSAGSSRTRVDRRPDGRILRAVETPRWRGLPQAPTGRLPLRAHYAKRPHQGLAAAPIEVRRLAHGSGELDSATIVLLECCSSLCTRCWTATCCLPGRATGSREGQEAPSLTGVPPTSVACDSSVRLPSISARLVKLPNFGKASRARTRADRSQQTLAFPTKRRLQSNPNEIRPPPWHTSIRRPHWRNDRPTGARPRSPVTMCRRTQLRYSLQPVHQ